MQLTTQQLKAFDDQGYVFLPNCFADEEVALMRSEGEDILKADRQEVWREKTGAPRTAFAAHTFNELFRLLVSHPRLVGPLKQYFAEDVYVTSSSSTPRRRSRARSGNGTRTTAPGRATTACRRPAR